MPARRSIAAAIALFAALWLPTGVLYGAAAVVLGRTQPEVT
jgi:hypothetical protein